MLMGVERLESITRKMLAHGMRADFARSGVIRGATTGQQQNTCRTLQEIAQQATRKNLARRPLQFSVMLFRCAKSGLV